MRSPWRFPEETGTAGDTSRSGGAGLNGMAADGGKSLPLKFSIWSGEYTGRWTHGIQEKMGKSVAQKGRRLQPLRKFYAQLPSTARPRKYGTPTHGRSIPRRELWI